MDWYSDTLPGPKWRFCDGAALSRTEFSLLFSRIGTGYGVGDGSTTFNLPNRTGNVAVGFSSADTDFDNLGDTGGSKSVTLTTAEMPAHSHGPGSYGVRVSSFVAAGGPNSGVFPDSGGGPSTAHFGGTSASEGGGGAHQNMPPFLVVRPIIKVM